MQRLPATLLAVAALLASCGAAPPAGQGDQRVRLPDGRRLFVTCAGAGTPTVILEAGWSGDHTAWTRVMPALAAVTRVCAYDRAGMGRSDPAPVPRDGRAIARDLDQALAAARIGGPYVLVGHSTGALYARLFYDRRPRRVAGMVLVDGTVEHLQRRFEAVYGPGAGSLTPLIARARDCVAALEASGTATPPPACTLPPPAAMRWKDRLSELETLFGATSTQIDAGRQSYGDLPLVTLTAGNTYSGGGARLWFDLHREVARRSIRGDARLVADSGHNIAHDRPDAVIRAVTDVIALAREQPAPPR